MSFRKHAQRRNYAWSKRPHESVDEYTGSQSEFARVTAELVSFDYSERS